MTYEQTMAAGARQYRDVIEGLAAAGLPATFTQTGGMNAALEVLLDGGHALLVTDAEDSLSWARAEQAGWGVGLYARGEQYDGQCLAWACTADTSMAALQAVIGEVLRAGVAAG
jgi:hypothetical protein